MKNYYTIAVLVLMAGCELPQQSIVVMGDSRAAGYWVPDGGKEQYGPKWPDILYAQVRDRYTVENCAVAGETIDVAVKRLQSGAYDSANVLILQYGWNDIALRRLDKGTVITPDLWRESLAFVRDWADLHHAQLIVLDSTSPTYAPGHPAERDVLTIYGFRDGAEMIARRDQYQRILDAELGPAIVKTGLTQECFEQRDFVHPNPQGAYRTANAVFDALLVRQRVAAR